MVVVDGQPIQDGLNFVNPADPKPFRRRQRSTYVIAVHTLPETPPDVLRNEYPMLVRALANLALLVVPGDACYFVTPEQGVYSVPDPGDLGEWADALFDRIEPLATSRLVIDNRFDTDLEPELWDGDEQTEALYRAGQHPGYRCCAGPAPGSLAGRPVITLSIPATGVVASAKRSRVH